VVAAGTIQPVVSVVVSSQVSGQVKEILVDHNDAVKEGQPIALLDPELFNTRVEQARAEVDIATDAVRIAQEEVTTAEAVVNRAVVNRAIAERSKAEADSKRYEVMIGLTRQRLEREVRAGEEWSSLDDRHGRCSCRLRDRGGRLRRGRRPSSVARGQSPRGENPTRRRAVPHSPL